MINTFDSDCGHISKQTPARSHRKPMLMLCVCVWFLVCVYRDPAATLLEVTGLFESDTKELWYIEEGNYSAERSVCVCVCLCTCTKLCVCVSKFVCVQVKTLSPAKLARPVDPVLVDQQIWSTSRPARPGFTTFTTLLFSFIYNLIKCFIIIIVFIYISSITYRSVWQVNYLLLFINTCVRWYNIIL